MCFNIIGEIESVIFKLLVILIAKLSFVRVYFSHCFPYCNVLFSGGVVSSVSLPVFGLSICWVFYRFGQFVWVFTHSLNFRVRWIVSAECSSSVSYVDSPSWKVMPCIKKSACLRMLSGTFLVSTQLWWSFDMFFGPLALWCHYNGTWSELRAELVVHSALLINDTLTILS